MLYFIVLVMQVLCVLHVIKQKKETWWIWVIVLLPLMGAVVYLLVVGRKDNVTLIRAAQERANELVNKGDMKSVAEKQKLGEQQAKLKALEERVAFSDTFTNRVALADFYMEMDRFVDAIQLYEKSLVGIYADDEVTSKQLARSYFLAGEYEKAVLLIGKFKGTYNFYGSDVSVLLALSLEKLCKHDLAEKEFRAIIRPYGDYPPRVAFAKFLVRQKRLDEARTVLNKVIAEYDELGKNERMYYEAWYLKAKFELEALDQAKV